MLHEALSRIEKERRNKTGKLDLSDCHLTFIPKEISELTSLNTLYLSGNQLSKIEGLETLTTLKSLYLHNNQLTKIEGLEKLTALNKLDLSGNELTKIDGLQTLTALNSLGLSENQLTKIDGLEALTALNTLDLEGNQITKIEGLESLFQLKRLILGFNNITKIEGLESLSHLSSFSLQNGQIIKIEGLESLLQLNELNLSNNQLTKIEGLESLSQLNKLYFDSNQIKKIEGLTFLTQLNELSLFSNHIKKIEGLTFLTQLNELSLFSNHIKKIEGLESLSQISTFDLSDNHIKKIEGLESLSQLDSLYLSDNQIKKIEGLESLSQLIKLDIDGNQIENIEGLLHLQDLKALKILKIDGNPIASNLDLYDLDSNHFQEVLNWLSRQQEETFPVKLPLKVVLLGNHASGKSTLLHFLLTSKIKDHDSTHGLKIEYMDDPKAVFFDFGGQDYYHGMYQPFLSKDALYLVLWKHSTNKNERIDYDTNGFACHHFQLSYWLAQKRYLEKEVYSTDKDQVDDPKLVIQTFYKESGETGVEPNLGLADNEKMTLSLKSGNEKNCTTQKQEIVGKIEDLLQKEKNQKKEPKWYIDFIDYLINEGKENDRFRNLNDLLHDGQPIYAIKKGDKFSSLKTELKLLHQRGIVLYYEKINEQLYWPGPLSFAKYVYDHILVKNYLKKKVRGIIHKKMFKYNETVINILIQQKIIFFDNDNLQYIIPGFLRLTSDDPKYHKNTENVNKPLFYLYFKEYLPFGYVNQLISSIGQEGIHLHYWRDEVYFLFKEIRIRINLDYKNLKISVFANQLVETDLKAYLFYVLLAEYWGMKILKFEAYQNIKKVKSINKSIESTEEENFERLFTKEQCRPDDLYISMDDNKYVKYKDVWDCKGELVPFEELNNNTLRASSDTTLVIPFKELIQHNNMEIKKDKLNVMICYSKQDLKLVNAFRKELIPLEDMNYLNKSWYCTLLVAGEKWDNEIKKQLSNADIIFFMCSSNLTANKYVKTNEITYAKENAKTIVPIILSFCQWEPYLGDYTALPYTGKPIIDFKDQSMAWYLVIEGIKLMLSEEAELDLKLQKLFERVIKGKVDNNS